MDWMNAPHLYSYETGQPQAKPQSNFWTSLIPSGGGIVGAMGGAAAGTAIMPGIGTILGGLAGGFLGGGGGKVAENAIEGNQNLWSGVPQEAALNGVFGAGPLRLGKLGLETINGLRGVGTAGADVLANAGANEGAQALTDAGATAGAKSIPIRYESSTTPGAISSIKPNIDFPTYIRNNLTPGVNTPSLTDTSAKFLQNNPSAAYRAFSKIGPDTDPVTGVAHYLTDASKGDTRNAISNLFPVGLASNDKNVLTKSIYGMSSPTDIRSALNSQLDRMNQPMEPVAPGSTKIGFTGPTNTETGTILGNTPTTTSFAAPSPPVPFNSNPSNINFGQILQNAGNKAMDSSVTGTIAKGLGKASDNLAVKEFRLTPSQLANFQSKYGEDASQVIKRYGLIGKDSGTIAQNVIQPLSQDYGNIVGQIPSVSTDNLMSALKSKYQPMLDSGISDKVAMGQQLQQEAQQLADKFPDSIPGDQLSGLRKGYDSLVNYTQQASNPARYGVNKNMADAIRGTMQDTADNLGLKSSSGMSLKDTGQELSKLYQLNGNIAKQEQLGRGSLPLSLPDLIGATAGGGTGLGPVGAIGGVAATHLLNSPMARQIQALGADKLSQTLAGRAAKLAPYGLKSVAGRVLPANMAANAIGSQGLDSNLTNNFSSPSTAMQATNIPNMSNAPNNMSTSYDPSNPNASTNIFQDPATALAAMQQMNQQASTPVQQDTSTPSISGYSDDQLTQGLVNATQAGDAKAAAQIEKLLSINQTYEKAHPQGGPGKLTLTQQRGIAPVNTAIDYLQQLYKQYNDLGISDGPMGMFQGGLDTLMGNMGMNDKAKAYNDSRAEVGRAIASALSSTTSGSGGSSDAAAANAEQELPSLFESRGAGIAKLQSIIQKLMSKQKEIYNMPDAPATVPQVNYSGAGFSSNPAQVVFPQ